VFVLSIFVAIAERCWACRIARVSGWGEHIAVASEPVCCVQLRLNDPTLDLREYIPLNAKRMQLIGYKRTLILESDTVSRSYPMTSYNWNEKINLFIGISVF
jgi:hypothetical protein